MEITINRTEPDPAACEARPEDVTQPLNLKPAPALSHQTAAMLREGLNALRLYDLEGYETAVARLRQVLSDAPECAEAHAALGETYAYWGFRQELEGTDAQSLYDLALQHARLALQAGPESSSSHRSMAVALRRGERHDPERRLQEIMSAIDLDPKSAENWYELWRASGYDPDDASIGKALALDSNLVGACVDLGVALYQHGRPAGAVEYFLKALKINPRHTLASYNLAMVLDEQGDHVRAGLVMRRALELRPGDPLLESGRRLLAAVGKRS